MKAIRLDVDVVGFYEIKLCVSNKNDKPPVIDIAIRKLGNTHPIALLSLMDSIDGLKNLKDGIDEIIKMYFRELDTWCDIHKNRHLFDINLEKLKDTFPEIYNELKPKYEEYQKQKVDEREMNIINVLIEHSNEDLLVSNIIKESGVSKAITYRILHLLEKSNLVIRTEEDPLKFMANLSDLAILELLKEKKVV